MGLTYFKRYRMEVDLRDRTFPIFPLPAGYRLIGWDWSLLEAHAEAKYQSFRFEIDANVFPCLGEADGCLRLMKEIARKDGFLPEATWLIAWDVPDSRRLEFCGTIQGVRDRAGVGAIQNLGVTPRHRNLNLGSILLSSALTGFQRAGLSQAFLEVTAQNCGAIRLYERMGFATARTVYKAVEVAYS